MSDSGAGRRAFISYTRADEGRVEDLDAGLTRLGCRVWRDDALTGGQDWWEKILAEIEDSDVVALALSPSWLRSEAVRLEADYARALGIPLLPVVVAPVALSLLPVELATLQVVPFVEHNIEAVYALAGALVQLPARRAADGGPRPPKPAPPTSYLSEISSRLRAASLNQDEQFGLVARLRAAKSEDWGAARALLETMNERSDLYLAVSRQIAEALSREPDPEPVQPADTTGWTATVLVQGAWRVVLDLQLSERHQLDFRGSPISASTVAMGGVVTMTKHDAESRTEIASFEFVDGTFRRHATVRVETRKAFYTIRGFFLAVDDEVVLDWKSA